MKKGSCYLKGVTCEKGVSKGSLILLGYRVQERKTVAKMGMTDDFQKKK